MDRMKTFLTYLIIVIAFFIVSNFLENGLIKNMYYDMRGEVNGDFIYNGESAYIEIEVNEAKSTRMNGYIDLTITNKSSIDIKEAYLKVELYSKSNVLAITKYMDIQDLKSGEARNYKLNFEGKYIKRYNINVENEYPDKEYIFTFFGYEINTKNIFGLDLSEYLNAETLSSFGKSVWNSFTITVKNIPWWAWFWAWMIVVGVW